MQQIGQPFSLSARLPCVEVAVGTGKVTVVHGTGFGRVHRVARRVARVRCNPREERHRFAPGISDRSGERVVGPRRVDHDPVGSVKVTSLSEVSTRLRPNQD